MLKNEQRPPSNWEAYLTHILDPDNFDQILGPKLNLIQEHMILSDQISGLIKSPGRNLPSDHDVKLDLGMDERGLPTLDLDNHVLSLWIPHVKSSDDVHKQVFSVFESLSRDLVQGGVIQYLCYSANFFKMSPSLFSGAEVFEGVAYSFDNDFLIRWPGWEDVAAEWLNTLGRDEFIELLSTYKCKLTGLDYKVASKSDPEMTRYQRNSIAFHLVTGQKLTALTAASYNRDNLQSVFHEELSRSKRLIPIDGKSNTNVQFFLKKVGTLDLTKCRMVVPDGETLLSLSLDQIKKIGELQISSISSDRQLDYLDYLTKLNLVHHLTGELVLLYTGVLDWGAIGKDLCDVWDLLTERNRMIYGDQVDWSDSTPNITILPTSDKLSVFTLTEE